MNADEAKRKAEAAPDREKLLQLSRMLLLVECREMSTKDGRKILVEAGEKLDALAAWIRGKAGEL